MLHDFQRFPGLRPFRIKSRPVKAMHIADEHECIRNLKIAVVKHDPLGELAAELVAERRKEFVGKTM